MNERSWSEYAEHRTGVEVNELLRYGHFIPVGRGYTVAYVAEHYPGWTWNELMDVWRSAGIVELHGYSSPTCDERVKAIHFNGPGSFAVEWIDGSVTTS